MAFLMFYTPNPTGTQLTEAENKRELGRHNQYVWMAPCNLARAINPLSPSVCETLSGRSESHDFSRSWAKCRAQTETQGSGLLRGTMPVETQL